MVRLRETTSHAGTCETEALDFPGVEGPSVTASELAERATRGVPRVVPLGACSSRSRLRSPALGASGARRHGCCSTGSLDAAALQRAQRTLESRTRRRGSSAPRARRSIVADHPAFVSRGQRPRRNLGGVSNAAQDRSDVPHGTSRLPRDLTVDELAAAPVLAALDALLIDELSDEEDNAFAAALNG